MRYLVENIQEKMYMLESNMKNNLIFYGIPAPRNETRHSLAKTIQDSAANRLIGEVVQSRSGYYRFHI